MQKYEWSEKNIPLEKINSITSKIADDLRNLDFFCLWLIGDIGAGKTTLFRLLNATLKPTNGTLRFDGEDLSSLSGRDLRSVRRRIGTIYQQQHLVPSLSVLENTLCGKLGSWSFASTLISLVRPRKQEIAQAQAALESVGLADKQRARADELSGGQQQRLTIARVLMQDPDVILADEPFASLDPALAETISSLLLGLASNSHRTLVATMHDVELALKLFPRIIGIREGRIVFDLAAAAVDRVAVAGLYAGEQTDGAGGAVGTAAAEANENERRSRSACAR